MYTDIIEQRYGVGSYLVYTPSLCIPALTHTGTLVTSSPLYKLSCKPLTLIKIIFIIYYRYLISDLSPKLTTVADPNMPWWSMPTLNMRLTLTPTQLNNMLFGILRGTLYYCAAVLAIAWLADISGVYGLFRRMARYLSLCLSVCFSLLLSVYLSICLTLTHTPLSLFLLFTH